MHILKSKSKEMQVFLSILAVSTILYINIGPQISFAQENTNQTMTCSTNGGNVTALAAGGCKCQRCFCTQEGCDCTDCTCG